MKADFQRNSQRRRKSAKEEDDSALVPSSVCRNWGGISLASESGSIERACNEELGSG